MIIRFSKSFVLPIETIFDYFASPEGWVRLYGFGGDPRPLGDGWHEVPLRRFPFPLTTRITACEKFTLVRWSYQGFWRGDGEVRFAERDGRTYVSGIEEISIRWLAGASRIVERLFMEQPFRDLWELGWRRLRQQETQCPATTVPGRP